MTSTNKFKNFLNIVYEPYKTLASCPICLFLNYHLGLVFSRSQNKFLKEKKRGSKKSAWHTGKFKKKNHEP